MDGKKYVAWIGWSDAAAQQQQTPDCERDQRIRPLTPPQRCILFSLDYRYPGLEGSYAQTA
jgi:hypothetical protein